ncbi:Hypothetical predicted protein [Podarcis lilfordi]|uniref:Uncharacterized protein n=1 Tax=Podarcis lilfordi TaxID=74358 RepID=A0AA35P104_9SAUR|nr:Hypothetical predicted protein [Podarcis lilfordi]
MPPLNSLSPNSFLSLAPPLATPLPRPLPEPRRPPSPPLAPAKIQTEAAAQGLGGVRLSQNNSQPWMHKLLSRPLASLLGGRDQGRVALHPQ